MPIQAADETEWLSVDGSSIVTGTGGRTALGTAVTEYFQSVPAARSVIEASMVSGSFVAIRERAVRHVDGEERNQISLGIDEVRGGKIRRVWSFPAKKGP